MNTEQIKLCRTLLSKAGLAQYKEDLVLTFTDERTSHLGDMTYDETMVFVKHLRQVSGQFENPKEKMQKKILAMAHEMHWELPGGKVNMERVNNWCVRYSGKNKPLNEFKYSELPTLVTQFESVYRAFLKGI